MSQNCDFDSHIASVAKKCSRLRRRDRYMAIYIWKIVEENVPNFSPPIQGHISAHRGRLCNSGVVPTGHLGTLCHNSFRSKAATIFNCLPKHIRNLVNCANTSIFQRAQIIICVQSRTLLWYRTSAAVSPLDPRKMQQTRSGGLPLLTKLNKQTA